MVYLLKFTPINVNQTEVDVPYMDAFATHPEQTALEASDKDSRPTS